MVLAEHSEENNMKVIGHKKVDVSDQEYQYYKSLVSFYTQNGFNGESYFNNLFETDENGIINLITPQKSIPWAIIFFIQNVMINQHLSMFEKRISIIEEKLGDNNE